MAQRFGPDRVQVMNARMAHMGNAEGIDFTFKGLVGNTRDAHRLVQLAKKKSLEVQGKVMEELFHSYHENGGDITSHDMLIAAAEKGGVDAAEAKAWLAGESGGPEVDKEVQEAYRAGISGVPSFTINEKYKLDGAQDVITILQTLAAASGSSSGGKQKNGLAC